MKITVEYEGQPIVVDIPDETLKKIADSQKKKTGWEKPNDSDTFYLIDEDYRVKSYGFLKGGRSSERCYHVGNCFTSFKFAETIARYQSLDLRIRRRIAEICEPVDWNDNSTIKFFVYFNHHFRHLAVDNSFCHHCGGWYCDTEEHAEQIINEFREELMWYFTEFKDRMDVNA